MKFLDVIELNPKISLTKGKVYPFVEMANVGFYERNPNVIDYKPFTSGVKFEKGDTVIARITPCLQNGKGFYCNKFDQGFGSTEYLVFRPKSQNIDNRYLYYFMQTRFIRENMIKSMVGATGRQRVNNDVFERLEVNFPELPEQIKIADTLSAYDDLIENNQKQIKLLEEAAQRLYKEWFVDLRFPGYEDVKIVDGVPEGWKKTNIGEYIAVRSGYAFKSSWWRKDGYPVVKIKDISNNTIDLSNFDCVEPEKIKKAKDFKLKKGDIVIAMTGATIGKIGLVPEIGNLYTNQRVGKVFVRDDSIIQTPFIFCFYMQKHILEQIIAVSSSSSAQPNISGSQLESFELISNDLVVKRFCETCMPNFEVISVLTNQIILAQQARDRLLPKLMSGELEV